MAAAGTWNAGCRKVAPRAGASKAPAASVTARSRQMTRIRSGRTGSRRQSGDGALDVQAWAVIEEDEAPHAVFGLVHLEHQRAWTIDAGRARPFGGLAIVGVRRG